MRTLTVYFQNDDDAKKLMNTIETTNFEEAVEVYEMDEDISDEDIDSFEESLDAFHEEDITEAAYLKFKTEMKEKYGIGYIVKLK